MAQLSAHYAADSSSVNVEVETKPEFASSVTESVSYPSAPFRYRAWLPATRQMLLVRSIVYPTTTQQGYVELEGQSGAYFFDEVVLLVEATFRAKDGGPLHDDDIIRDDRDDTLSRIKFRPHLGWDCFAVDNPTDEYGGFILPEDSPYLTVVGNIYETPDLLVISQPLSPGSTDT